LNKFETYKTEMKSEKKLEGHFCILAKKFIKKMFIINIKYTHIYNKLDTRNSQIFTFYS